MRKTAIVTIHNEVSLSVSGVSDYHLKQCYEQYGIRVEGYRFNPLFVLGKWDGFQRFFSKTGLGFLYHIDTLLPLLTGLGYKLSIRDMRKCQTIAPPLIDKFFLKDINFIGSNDPITLRDEQVRAINGLLEHGNGICEGATGMGKAQPLSAKILTPTGFNTMGSMGVGSVVTSPRGKHSIVTEVHPQGNIPVYEFCFDDGAKTRACLHHLWKLSNGDVIGTSDIIERMYTINKNPNTSGEVIMGDYDVYTTTKLAISVGLEFPLVDFLWKISYPERIWLNGYISEQVTNPDGSIHKLYYLSAADEARKILAMCRSNGVWCLLTVEINGKFLCDIQPTRRQQMEFFGEDYCNFPERVTRKLISIKKLASCPAVCISLDSEDELYVTDDYIVTHNTITCAALVKSYDAFNIRSMTIVPNETLLVQTRNEYENAKIDIGTYAKKKLGELERRHAIGTWQALKNNPTVLKLYQMVIVDECHTAAGDKLYEMLRVSANHIPYRFGFTGTIPKQEVKAEKIFVCLNKVRTVVTAKELMDKGDLAQLHITVVQIIEDLTKQYQDYEVEYNSEPNYAQSFLSGNTAKLTYLQFKKQFFQDYEHEKSYLQIRKGRREIIASIIAQMRSKEKGNVLVLVNSKKDGKLLNEIIPNSTFLHGTSTKKASDRTVEYDKFGDNNNIVLIATVHIAGVGLNIPRIFSMFMIDLGKSFERIIQAIGRSLRVAEDKDSIDVFDICSDLKYSTRHRNIRIGYYKEHKYKFTKYKL